MTRSQVVVVVALLLAATAACRGASGTAGTEGMRGPEGPRGVQGSAGEQGVQGIQGEPGVSGAEGPQGPEGPAGGGPTWVDASGAVIRGITMPAMYSLNEPFAAYFDSVGTVWNIDPLTCVVKPWMAGSIVYESTDCTGTGSFMSGTDQPFAPRFALSDGVGAVRVANDDRHAARISICSVLLSGGACQAFGTVSNPCWSSWVTPLAETSEVTLPGAVCVPPLHPEMR